ncbi:magnesium/cobalt transporter CorA [Candidatus Latescibacterota bacterium]
MARLIKKRTLTIGMPPGSLIHIGEQKEENVRISYMKYNENHFEEKQDVKLDVCFQNSHKSDVFWINIDGIHNPEILKKIGITYKIHSLVLEDILNTSQRPKYEDYGDYVYLVTKIPIFDKEKKLLKLEQISIILINNVVISFQEKTGDIFKPVLDRIRYAKGRIRKMQSDYLAYALTDAIVDHYFVVLERLADNTEKLEEEIIGDSQPEILHRIHIIKGEMIQLRKAIWPMKEMAESLVNNHSAILSDSLGLFFRDLSDHTIQLYETVEMLRDMINRIFDIFTSQNSGKLNNIVKILTIFTAIFIPLTFIAGIYGMNFVYMPELSSAMGYPTVLLIMLSVAGVILYFFKRKKWL